MTSDRPPQSSVNPNYKPGMHAAHQLGSIGMWLFLAALTMLFAASLVGYIVIRLAGPAAGAVRLPPELWLSTTLVIGVSIAMGWTLHQVRRERQPAFRAGLLAALLLAAGFIAVQTPALVGLLGEHLHRLAQLRAQNQVARSAGVALYGLVFVLILLHALHVLGGIIALVSVAYRGRRGDFDHEHYLPVLHATMYWHFLDVVWIVMFSTFWALR